MYFLWCDLTWDWNHHRSPSKQAHFIATTLKWFIDTKLKTCVCHTIYICEIYDASNNLHIPEHIKNCIISYFFCLILGPGGTPRPIELHSHDPLRYVGDMLAWLHQATASEKEHLQTLLKKCSSKSKNSMQ